MSVYTPKVTAARERRRIRRLIAPHLEGLRSTIEYVRRHSNPVAAQAASEISDAIRAIDAATRAPKKGKR